MLITSLSSVRFLNLNRMKTKKLYCIYHWHSELQCSNSVGAFHSVGSNFPSRKSCQRVPQIWDFFFSCAFVCYTIQPYSVINVMHSCKPGLPFQKLQLWFISTKDVRENRSICPVVSFCSTDCKSLWLGIESVPFPLVRVGLTCVEKTLNESL